MRDNQGSNPNRKLLVFWNSAVDAIEQLLVLILNRLPSDIALGGGARKSAAFNNDNVFGGCDALMDISARVELPRPPDNFLLELLSVHGALLRSLDEQGGGRSAVSDHDTLENEFAARSAGVVLDRPGVTNDKYL